MGAGQGRTADAAVVRPSSRDLALDDGGAFPVSELAHVEVAGHPVETFEREPAQEDVARRGHDVLTVDDALAVRDVSARSDEVLEHRGLGLFGLKEQRIGVVAAEHQQDPCSGTDAAHPDHLASGVDQLEVLEQVATVRLEGAAVAAQDSPEPVHDLVSSPSARELFDGLDEGRVADDASLAVDDVCELVEGLHAVAGAGLGHVGLASLEGSSVELGLHLLEQRVATSKREYHTSRLVISAN